MPGLLAGAYNTAKPIAFVYGHSSMPCIKYTTV